MDYRKLISFGKGGYVISVPKDWVVENKLEKGSFIAVEKKSGDLNLSARSPQNRNSSEESEIVIDVDGEARPNIYRKLRSAYLNSYSTIILRGEELKDKRERIKKRIDKLIALEIFESSRNRMVLKDLMDFNNIDFLKDFKRMDMTVRSMMIDLKNLDPTFYESIEARDDEVDRLFFLLLKAIKKSLKDSQLLKKFNLNITEAMNYKVYIYSLENFGDELISLLEMVKKAKLDKEAKKDFLTVFNKMEGLYLETMRIIHTNDFKSSFNKAEEHKEAIEECFNLQKKHINKTGVLRLFNQVVNLLNLTRIIIKNYYY